MKSAWFLLLFLVSGLVCIAENFRCCPPWQVAVVNQEGKPLADCTVIQEWGYNFGDLATNFTATVTTDAKGHALLPGRWLSRTGGSPLKKLANDLSLRPDVGPWASLFVWKQGYDHQMIMLKNDSRVLYTTNGVYSRIVLSPAEGSK